MNLTYLINCQFTIVNKKDFVFCDLWEWGIFLFI